MHHRDFNSEQIVDQSRILLIPLHDEVAGRARSISEVLSLVPESNRFQVYDSSSPPNRCRCRCRDDNSTVARLRLIGPVLPLITHGVRVAEAVRSAVMRKFQQILHFRKYGKSTKPYREFFRSRTLSGKDTAGWPLAGHGHAYYLPTADGADRRRITHVTVVAQSGFGSDEVAAMSGLRFIRAGELELRAQLVGLGDAREFTASLLQSSKLWVSATPFVGPAHIGQSGRARYLRKALRRELRRALGEVALNITDLNGSTNSSSPGPLPFEFRRGRSKRGDTGYSRPCGMFRLEFDKAITGPLCVGYASHFGLGLFLPADS